MSYEPTIIIRKSDLEKHREHIEYSEWEVIEKKKFTGRGAATRKQELIDAYSKLKEALEYETIKFTEIELVLLYVEFTYANANVRELLDELKIDYRLDN